MSEARPNNAATPMFTRKLPPGRQTGLEPCAFIRLLKTACREYCELLIKKQAKRYYRTIFITEEKAIQSKEIEFPKYVWNDYMLDEELDLPGLKDLFDYLWARGEPVYTLRGPDPQRRSWEYFVLKDMVHTPVVRALDDAAIDEAIDYGTVKFGKLPEQAIEAELDAQILRWCNNTYSYIANCPIGYLNIAPGTIWNLADGVKLRGYTPREIAKYLSKNFYQFYFPELYHLFELDRNSVLEIYGTCVCDRKEPDSIIKLENAIKEDILNKIDAFKWAVMASIPGENPLQEGIITYEISSDNNFPVFFGRGVPASSTSDATRR